jgi:hypothetical protein
MRRTEAKAALRRLLQRADISAAQVASEGPSPVSLREAVKVCAFRSLLLSHDEDAPILGVWAIIGMPALPVPDDILAGAEDAFRRGGHFLIMATDREQRDIAKRALMLRFGQQEGSA